MPNYVMNTITITGKNTNLERFVNEIFDGNVENGFDFEKLMPIPKDLHITSGSDSDKALVLALFKKYGYGPLPLDEPLQCAMNSMYKYGGIAPKKHLSVEEVEQAKQSFSDKPESQDKSYLFAWGYSNFPRSLKDALYLGQVMISSVERYGTKDWYDWCVENWGTKWNACETTCIRETSRKLHLKFTTAWSCPYSVLTTMVKKYHELRFLGQYSDEDSGGKNHGEWSGIAGKISETACGRRKMNAIYRNLWGEIEE